VGTLGHYADRVSKPRYSPPTPEVAAEVDAVAELHRKWQEAEAEYKGRLARLIDPQGDWKVPVAHIADRLGVERKTVYRHTGRSMT
jgi:hypothetical protein